MLLSLGLEVLDASVGLGATIALMRGVHKRFQTTRERNGELVCLLGRYDGPVPDDLEFDHWEIMETWTGTARQVHENKIFGASDSKMHRAYPLYHRKAVKDATI